MQQLLRICHITRCILDSCVNIIIQEVIMEFISSNKGSLKLLYYGFSYVKQKFDVNEDNHCSPYIYKEFSVTICKDSQITALKMVKIVMFMSI